MHWMKVDLNIRSHFGNEKIYPQQQITKNEIEKKIYMVYPTYIVLMFQQILVNTSSAYWVGISQIRVSVVNCSTMTMSKIVMVLFPTLKL